MPTNDFKAFATGVGANVITQIVYAAAAYLSTGRGSGILPSDVYNKIARQSSLAAYVFAQTIVDKLGLDALDDGDLPTLLARYKSSISVTALNKPSRIVTVSTALTVLTTDYAIGLNRTAAPAATAAALPNGAVAGDEYVIDDLAGNFNAFPVTVSPPAGHTIAGLATWVCNVDRSSNGFRFYGSNIWSVR